MTGYTLEFSCPRCGGEMLPAESEVLAPDHSTHQARCDRCLDLYRVDVVATVVEAWPVDRVGSEAVERRLRGEAAWAISPTEMNS